jgi:hypothetical protein
MKLLSKIILILFITLSFQNVMGIGGPDQIDEPGQRNYSNTGITRREDPFKALVNKPSSFANDTQLFYHQPWNARKKVFCTLAALLALATGGEFLTSAMVPYTAPSWHDQSICHLGVSYIGGNQMIAPFAPFHVTSAQATAYCEPTSFWGSGKTLRKKVQDESANYGHRRAGLEFTYPPQISFGTASSMACLLYTSPSPRDH